MKQLAGAATDNELEGRGDAKETKGEGQHLGKAKEACDGGRRGKAIRKQVDKNNKTKTPVA